MYVGVVLFVLELGKVLAGVPVHQLLVHTHQLLHRHIFSYPSSSVELQIQVKMIRIRPSRKLTGIGSRSEHFQITDPATDPIKTRHGSGFATLLDIRCVQEVVTPFYIVSYYIKWVTTSWTHGNI